MLRPLSLPQLQAMPAAWQAQHASLTLVLSGELTESTEVEVELKYIGDGGNGGGGEKDKDAVAGGEVYELKVTIDGRDRLLADLTATLSDLALDVLDGDIATDEFGRAVDTLRVRDVGGSRGSREGSFRGGSLFGLAQPVGRFWQRLVCGRLYEQPKLVGQRPGPPSDAPPATTRRPRPSAATLKERSGGCARSRRLDSSLASTRRRHSRLLRIRARRAYGCVGGHARAGAVLALDRNALGPAFAPSCAATTRPSSPTS